MWIMKLPVLKKLKIWLKKTNKKLKIIQLFQLKELLLMRRFWKNNSNRKFKTLSKTLMLLNHQLCMISKMSVRVLRRNLTKNSMNFLIFWKLMMLYVNITKTLIEVKLLNTIDIPLHWDLLNKTLMIYFSCIQLYWWRETTCAPTECWQSTLH